ncbi:hypothetical protein [Jatrophihabitans fulvus]
MAPSRRVLAPVVTTVLAAVALVAALLAFLFVDTDEKAASARTFTADETAAINAAQTDVANISSLRRSRFDADWNRAVSGLTGDLATQFSRNKATYRKTLVDGKFDLVAKVLHTALVGPVDDDDVDGYLVLVSFNGYRSDQLVVPSAQQNTLVTVVKKKGKWLAADLKNIGVTGGPESGGAALPGTGGASSGSGTTSGSTAPRTPATSTPRSPAPTTSSSR